MAIASSVRRERARRQELLEIKERIKNSLPVLNKRQIRRHRISYHEALILELEEDRYNESALFLKLLIDFQDSMRQEAGNESYIWFYPQLKFEKDKLNILYDGLRNSEAAKQAVDEVDNSIEELKTCREKSAGKLMWNARNELNMTELDCLFVESCKLLYKALLVLAKISLDDDPAKSARICQIAQNRAKDADDEKGVSECLLQLGICELRGGNANTALIKFNKVLTLSLTAKDPERICEARIQIALAQSRLGNLAESNSQLESLLNYAFENNLQYFYGQAHRFLGELYLNKGEPRLSTPLLIKAVEIFSAIDDTENTEQVKNLAAISAGQELLPNYVKLLLDCESNKKEIKEDNLMRLVGWKDLRKGFWGSQSFPDLSPYCEGKIGEIFIPGTSEISPEESAEYVAYEYDPTPDVSDIDHVCSLTHKKRNKKMFGSMGEECIYEEEEEEEETDSEESLTQVTHHPSLNDATNDNENNNNQDTNNKNDTNNQDTNNNNDNKNEDNSNNLKDTE